MENCANEWNLILFDRYTPVNDKIGYGENRESDYLCILTIYNFLLRTMRRYANLLAVLALSTNLALHAQTNELVIQTKKLGAEIQPTMYGLFFEDINYAADGGLYAELVKNRSFEFPQHLMGWKTYGKVSLMNDGPFERNPITCAFLTPDMHINIPDWITKVSSASVSRRERSIVSLFGRVCRKEVRKKH